MLWECFPPNLVRNAEQGDRHIGFTCSYDDYGPRRASGRRWPWPLALHHFVLADAVARDIVIAEDGSLVAIVKGQVLAPNRLHPTDFISDQWRRALAADLDQLPRSLEGGGPVRQRDNKGEAQQLSAAELRDARNALRQAAMGAKNRHVCLKGARCTATHDSGYVLTIVENPVYFGAACDTADIVVTPARLRVTECRSGALLFTGETLRRSGTREHPS